MKKVTKLAALFMTAALVLSFTGCNQNVDSQSGNPEPVADTTVWAAQPEDSRSCGAYSMAYYLAKTGQINPSAIQAKADEFYTQIQFTNEELGEDYVSFSGYSNPVKILQKIVPQYAKTAKLKMLATPNTEAEQLLSQLATGMGITGIESISTFESGFGEGESCIEIVKSGSTSLHYLLTYKKGGVLFTRDPDDGKEYKRSEIRTSKTEYQFCNGGVFVTAKD